ncbi:MAG: hypothetical protein ABIN48_07710 [Ginsengibacter sp.]
MNKNLLTITLACFFISFNSYSCIAQQPKSSVKIGKYNCTASKYNNGSYEFIPRGSVRLDKNGNYTYLSLQKPSTGKYSVDKNGSILFKDGYLDKGKAEKTDRPDKYLLVFPSNPDNRWTFTWVE